MELINILLIGTGSGLIFAIISMIIINTSNSERYPIGGFLPALWILADLGESTKLVTAGLLMMGGITGFYLMLTFRQLRFDALRNIFLNKPEIEKGDDTVLANEPGTFSVKGKSLVEFLK